jgi:ATP-binding cassette subfamily F protein 3
LGKPVNILSGGQKTRALLARLILLAPDVLLLDEPTNHLDVSAVEWLEATLRDYRGGLILVSHDRYFIDAVAERCGSFGRKQVYRGNYTDYLLQRAERQFQLRRVRAAAGVIGKEEAIFAVISRQNTGRRRVAARAGTLEEISGVDHAA